MMMDRYSLTPWTFRAFLYLLIQDTQKDPNQYSLDKDAKEKGPLSSQYPVIVVSLMMPVLLTSKMWQKQVPRMKRKAAKRIKSYDSNKLKRGKS